MPGWRVEPFATIITSPPTAGPHLRDSKSSPMSSDGPKTPDTLPGITLTTPSPCSRNRSEQMQAMGSPLPGSAHANAPVFGGPLDLGIGNKESVNSHKPSSSRPLALFRSRSTRDELQGSSLVRQFIQGPIMPRHAYPEDHNLGSPISMGNPSRQRESNVLPVHKRQKVDAASKS
jgi:hypothetical protein